MQNKFLRSWLYIGIKWLGASRAEVKFTYGNKFLMMNGKLTVALEDAIS